MSEAWYLPPVPRASLREEEGCGAMTSGLLPFGAQVSHVSEHLSGDRWLVSPRPALLVIDDVLGMYLADPTGASSGSGWPGFARLADDLLSLACGAMLAQVWTL